MDVIPQIREENGLNRNHPLALTHVGYRPHATLREP